MAAVPSASLCMTLLSVVLSVSAGKEPITAEAGKNATLPCKALNNDPVTVLKWRRTDLKEDEYVLVYRDKKLDPENQHQSYQNRVDLQDRQMKNGDVSLILKNVTTEDRGTYECSVVQNKTNQKRSTIRLDVVPPGHTDERKEDGGDKEGGDKDGSVSLIVGLTVAGVAVLLIVVISLITVRHMKQKSSPPSSSSSSSPHPPSADQPLV